MALLTVRNEERYIGRCIKHLHSQDIEICVVDNGSTDRTMEIVGDLRHLGVVRVESQPYPGYFSLADQCRFQEHLSREMEADWFIHHDADEIRESDHRDQTLRQAISEIDAQGFTAINFDEFVFVPSSETEQSWDGDFVADLNHYYFFRPKPNHRVNAWKKLPGVLVDLIRSGGHDASFDGRMLADRSLVLRHYIVLNAEHAKEKYGPGRAYDPEETSSRGWHRAREAWKKRSFRFPSDLDLRRRVAGEPLDTSDPKTSHLFWE